MSPMQRIIITAACGTAILAGGIGCIFGWQLPRLQQLRDSIDNARAAVEIKTQEQQNYTALKKNLDTLQGQQQAFDADVWSFTTEEKFFTELTAAINGTGATCSEPQISDATPGPTIVTRKVTESCLGSWRSVLTVMSHIQTIIPLVAVGTVKIDQATEPSLVTLSFEASTLWR